LRTNVGIRTEAILAAASVFLATIVGAADPVERPEAVRIDFSRDIRPILSDNCYHCHGPDAESREADLRLDLRAGTLVDLGGYATLVPGAAEQSEMLAR